MMTRNQGMQLRMIVAFDPESLIPKDHLLRQINRLIDFRFIYDKVQHLYSAFGRPSIDPVILLKMLLIGYLYAIPSERQLEQEVTLNIAYRWFLGLHIDEPIPDHSTFSQNRRRRFGDANLLQELFDHLVRQCIEQGLVTGKIVVTDSTHIRADVCHGKNEVMVRVLKTPSAYLQELDAEADRLEAELQKKKEKEGGGSHKPGNRRQFGPKNKRPKIQKVKIHLTDPDARIMCRTGKPIGFHYLNHQTIDTKHGIAIDVHVTPGNVVDHEPYGDRLAHIGEKFKLPIDHAAADRGYDAISVHHRLNKLGIKALIPRKVMRGPAQTFRKDRFKYDGAHDCYICPADKRLQFRYISRASQQKFYTADADDCNSCPLRTQCVARSARVKHVNRPFYQDDADLTYSRIGTEIYKRAQNLRRNLCEGTFALQKRLHNLRRARMRGLKRVLEQSLGSAIAVNLKRMVRVMT